MAKFITKLNTNIHTIKYLRLLLLMAPLLLGPAKAAEIDWAHKKDGYKGNGQITAKDLQNQPIHISNAKKRLGLSTSSAPLVLTGGGSGEINYQWEGGVLASDGFYYLYESGLKTNVRYTAAELAEQFTVQDISLYALPTTLLARGNSYGSLSASNTGCGDDAWAAINGQCQVSCTRTAGPSGNQVTESTSGIGSCNLYGGWVDIIGSTPGYSVFYFSLTIFADVTLTIPMFFRPYMGNSVSASGRRSNNWAPRRETPDFGIPWSTSTSTSTGVDIRYYFDENWRGSGNPVAYIEPQSGSTRCLNVDLSQSLNCSKRIFNSDATIHYDWRNTGGSWSLIQLGDDGTDSATIVSDLPSSLGFPVKAIKVLSHTP